MKHLAFLVFLGLANARKLAPEDDVLSADFDAAFTDKDRMDLMDACYNSVNLRLKHKKEAEAFLESVKERGAEDTLADMAQRALECYVDGVEEVLQKDDEDRIDLNELKRRHFTLFRDVRQKYLEAGQDRMQKLVLKFHKKVAKGEAPVPPEKGQDREMAENNEAAQKEVKAEEEEEVAAKAKTEGSTKEEPAEGDDDVSLDDFDETLDGDVELTEEDKAAMEARRVEKEREEAEKKEAEKKRKEEFRKKQEEERAQKAKERRDAKKSASVPLENMGAGTQTMYVLAVFGLVFGGAVAGLMYMMNAPKPAGKKTSKKGPTKVPLGKRK